MTKKVLFLFSNVFVATSYSQDVTIKGTVTDVNNGPLIGVNVILEGTTTDVMTNLDGSFSLSGEKVCTYIS